MCVCVHTRINLCKGCCGLKDQQQEEVHDGPPITPTRWLHVWGERMKEWHPDEFMGLFAASPERNNSCGSEKPLLSSRHPDGYLLPRKDFWESRTCHRSFATWKHAAWVCAEIINIYAHQNLLLTSESNWAAWKSSANRTDLRPLNTETQTGFGSNLLSCP